MKKLFTTALLFALVLSSCQKSPDKNAIIEDFMEDFDDFYTLYADGGNPEFVDYYAEDVINMDDRGEISIGSKDYRDSWESLLEGYDVVVLDFTDPEIVFSKDQIVSMNDYYELFISKETGDTIPNKGTFIAVWQKYDDGWKVKMNTFHIKEE